MLSNIVMVKDHKLKQLPFASISELSLLSDKDGYNISMIMVQEKLTFFEAYNLWQSKKKGLRKFIE